MPPPSGPRGSPPLAGRWTPCLCTCFSPKACSGGRLLTPSGKGVSCGWRREEWAPQTCSPLPRRDRSAGSTRGQGTSVFPRLAVPSVTSSVSSPGGLPPTVPPSPCRSATSPAAPAQPRERRPWLTHWLARTHQTRSGAVRGRKLPRGRGAWPRPSPPPPALVWLRQRSVTTSSLLARIKRVGGAGGPPRPQDDQQPLGVQSQTHPLRTPSQDGGDTAPHSRGSQGRGPRALWTLRLPPPPPLHLPAGACALCLLHR